MSGRNASPPHAPMDSVDNRRERPEHDGHGDDRRHSRDHSPSPRQEKDDFNRPSRRSYSRSRSPEHDRGGQMKDARNGRNPSHSPARDRDHNRYYESDSPPRGSYRRGSRYRSRSPSGSSCGRSRSRSPGRHRHHRRDRGGSRRHRDRKRHRYDSRSRSRSRSPMRTGNGGYDDDGSRSSRSPPRRRARYDSRSPDGRGRYGRRGDFDRGGRRNRDRDRRDGRGRGGRGPFFDYQATQSLFVGALDSVAERHTPPFNVSIVNDRMRQLDRGWDVSNSDFKRFADLCHEMHRRGVLEVDRVRETICVTRFLPRQGQNGRPDEPRRRDDEHRFDRGNRGRDEYRWRRDEQGNYSRQLIGEDERRHSSRDGRTRMESEAIEDRKNDSKDNGPVEKNDAVNGAEKTTSTPDEKEVGKEPEVNGEKDVGSTEMEGVSTNPDGEAEKNGDADAENDGDADADAKKDVDAVGEKDADAHVEKGGDVDVAETGKKEEVVDADIAIGKNMNGDEADVGNTNLENEGKSTNGFSKKEPAATVDEKASDPVAT